MKKREVLSENKLFRLVKQIRDHKTWYELQVVTSWSNRTSMLEEELAAHFGPTRVKYTLTWRFWNRNEAQHQFLYATLKWC